MAAPRPVQGVHLGAGPVGGGAVGLDNLPIVQFDLSLKDGRDISVLVQALVAAIPVSMEEAATAAADRMVSQVKSDFGSTGLVRSGKLRPGAVHMQDWVFARYPQEGDAELTFGVFTGAPAWHTEYHEHGTFGQRKLPPGFRRQYRARRGGKVQATAVYGDTGRSLLQVQGRRPALRGRVGVRATYWFRDAVAKQTGPYVQAVARGLTTYLNAIEKGAAPNEATLQGLKTSFRSMGRAGVVQVATRAARQRVTLEGLP